MSDVPQTTDRMRVGGGAHSPGPWTATMSGEVFADFSDNKYPIAVLSKSNNRHHANPRLMAAAPTMLAALKRSRDFPILLGLRQIFDAAITKAKS